MRCTATHRVKHEGVIGVECDTKQQRTVSNTKGLEGWSAVHGSVPSSHPLQSLFHVGLYSKSRNAVMFRGTGMRCLPKRGVAVWEQNSVRTLHSTP